MLRFAGAVILSFMLVACSDSTPRPPDQDIQNLIELHLDAEGYLEITDIDHQASENKGSQTEPIIHARYEFTVKTLEDFVSRTSDIRVSTKPFKEIRVIKLLHKKGSELTGELIITARPYLERWTIDVETLDLEKTGIPFSNFERNGWEYIFEDDPKLKELKVKYQVIS